MIKREIPPQADVATWDCTVSGPPRIYKNRPKGASKKHPHSCLACYPQNCAGRVVRLTHGCSLVLCEGHRDPAFIVSEDGRRFIARVAALYASFGLVGARFETALRAFTGRCMAARRGNDPARPRPGSYAWAARRQAAETTWSRGGTWEQGWAAAWREEPGPRDLRLPTEGTVKRWWQQRRWLAPPLPAAALAMRG
jgi:hypothetical protein